MEAIVAVAIFLISLGLIMSERVHRTVVAVSGAALMVIAGLLMGFYDEARALEATDFETIGLLLGMMLLVALLAPTGFFQYIAVRTGQLSRGQPWRLMLLLGVGTGIISLVLNNVTAAVLIGPIAIMLAELMGVSPVPYLMAVGFAADTSGVGTSVGDPASVLIASASGNTFNDFLTHSLPIVALAVFATLLLLRFMFREELAAGKANHAAFLHLDASERLHDKGTMWRVLIVLALTVGLFTMQERLHVSAAFLALTGAAAALLWLHPDNMREVLGRIDWSVLLFFVGLFVMVGGLEETGILDAIARAVASISSNPVVLGIAIIWVVATLSGLVDNLPVTIAMIPVVHGLGRTGIDIRALWWAMAFGAGFGGDATVIGSTVNLVIVELSERTPTPIRPRMWSRWGVPVTIVTCTIASVLFAVGYNFLVR